MHKKKMNYRKPEMADSCFRSPWIVSGVFSQCWLAKSTFVKIVEDYSRPAKIFDQTSYEELPLDQVRSNVLVRLLCCNSFIFIMELFFKTSRTWCRMGLVPVFSMIRSWSSLTVMSCFLWEITDSNSCFICSLNWTWCKRLSKKLKVCDSVWFLVIVVIYLTLFRCSLKIALWSLTSAWWFILKLDIIKFRILLLVLKFISRLLVKIL